MTQTILTHTFSNGLVLVAEPMTSVESAGFTFLIPAGAVHDPDGRAGLSNFTCEMMLRGAGERDDRQFINDLEILGVEHGESVSAMHASYSGATVGENLHQALEIYADVLMRPRLPEDKLEAGRQVVMQEIFSVEDEPAQKLMQELRRRHYRPPLGLPSHGDLTGVQSITAADVRGCFERLYRPGGTILGVAGKIDWPSLKDHVEKLFANWRPKDVAPPQPGEPFGKRHHLDFDSQQTQIGVAYDSVPYRHPDYFHAYAGVGVLSSGMSSRLFTEVREKRSLCYSVYASYHSMRELGGVLCYAGSTADRAQETLDVMLSELRRLAEGIEESELLRLKARVKSALIMQQESSSARTAAIVRDWYHLDRVRTLDELGGLVDALTKESINRYLADHPPGDFTIVTLGSQALEA